MSDLGEYPLEPMAGVEPIFVRQMMLGAMQRRYQAAVPGLTDAEAYDSACATWDTDWPDDPEPRTFAAAEQVVDEDLSYWGEE